MKPAFSVCRTSDVYISPAARLLPDLLPEGRVIAVTDDEVYRCHGELLAPFETVRIGRGERCKTLSTVEELCRRLIAAGADRKTFILGVGGGIVTDVAGFAAATYMRGVGFGFVSTTLLGQVDASVGGKNGVNVAGYKNMVGTFTQPRFVVCDPSLLATLPDREFRAGLAEAVKVAVIGDGALFELLERSSFGELRGDAGLLGRIVESAVGVKAAIVGRDEHEAGERRKLNLGHTLAHAIEKCSDRMNHGEAVAVGTVLVADAAVRLGVLAPSVRDRIRALLVRLGFAVEPPVAVGELLQQVGKDKKSEAGILHVVFPTGIGSCEVRPMAREAFAALFDAENV